MVTYIKIGSCDELKEWGKYDPIPATTECCCCGTTVIDIITPNKDKPIVVPDKPSDSSSSSETKPSTDTSTTTPSDNTSSGSTDNSGTTTPSTPSTGDTTNPSDSGSSSNTDTNTTPSNDGSSSTDNTNTGSTSGDTSTTPSGNTDTGSTSNTNDNGSTGSTDTSSSSQTEPSKPAEKKITNTFNLAYSGKDKGVYYSFNISGNEGDIVPIWDYIKDKVKKNEKGQYYFTVDGVDYVYYGGDLSTEERLLEEDGYSEDIDFTHEEKPKEITKTVNLDYFGKDKGTYYTFNVSGNFGDILSIWDYFKDKVQQDEDGKYYITVNGDKYVYNDLIIKDLKKQFVSMDGNTTQIIPFYYKKEDKE